MDATTDTARLPALRRVLARPGVLAATTRLPLPPGRRAGAARPTGLRRPRVGRGAPGVSTGCRSTAGAAA